MRKHLRWTVLAAAAALGLLGLQDRGHAQKAAGKKIRVLLIDGQNNHDWRSTTPFLKKALEESGRFTVDVATAPEKPRPPKKPKDDSDPAAQAKYKEALEKFRAADAAYRAAMPKFRPDLARYEVLLSNYNGDSWPKEVNDTLERLLREGKLALVIVHAANNSFGGWKEYVQMVGMGWYNKTAGDRMFLDDEGKEVRIPTGQGDGPGHRYTGPFQVIVRDPSHPITRGMPREWAHTRDELYDNMRGPIENVRVLATAYSKGTKAHEPMIWTVSYGKGRVFHTPLGHDLTGMRCVGFVTTLRRGTEWAATGNVTIPIPEDFPTEKKASPIPGK